MCVGLGELLWDIYGETKRLGGAPANFAYHAAALGNQGIIASRIGADHLGQEALDWLSGVDLTTEFLQIDGTRPTGITQVEVDRRGEPSFTIPGEVAWDHLEWTAEWQRLAGTADVICFGSLALRSEHSRQTSLRFLQNARPGAIRMFDVNLRHSIGSAELLDRLFGLSEIAKLNEREMHQLASLLELRGNGITEWARQLLRRYTLQLVCVTMGGLGSVLVTDTDTVQHTAPQVDVVDTTGAGDAFGAALVHHYLRGAAPDTMARAANRLAAWVTTQMGATPAADAAVIAATREPESE